MRNRACKDDVVTMSTAKDKQRVMVTLTTQQVEQLDAIADETGVSRSAVVSLALSQWLRGWKLQEDSEALRKR